MDAPATYPVLDWLPEPPVDWRHRIDAIARGDAGWREAAALARTRLTFTRTNALHAASQNLGPPPLRLAVLSSSTSHHLVPGLRIAAMRRGLDLAVYEPDYGQARRELADPASGLRAFAPEAVLFAFDGAHVGAHARGATSADEADERVAALIGDWSTLWAAARAGGAVVMQQAVMPRLPAVGGSNERRDPASESAFVARVNAALRTGCDAAGVDLVALDEQVGVDGLAAWFSPTSWLSAKQEVALPAAPFYGDLVARVIAARFGRSPKCCVFDLDNTLWGGVIGDDGLDGIALGQGSAAGEAFLELHRLALSLKRRGILLAVCSKNDEAVAAQVFARHPDSLLGRDDFSCFVANWRDKATNLDAIARSLNIGTDALVFIDDNPYERGQVRDALPQVSVPELPDDPALFVPRIARSGLFELVVLTGEDAARSGLYATQARRAAALETTGDLDSFLAGLGMVLEHRPIGDGDLVRAAQLLNKTNQFNLATRRLGEDAVRALAADPDRLALGFRLKDRFGDNGLIAVVTGRFADGRIFVVEDWLMSCRVIGRDVEYATLVALVGYLRRRDVAAVEARYVPSGRNGMVADLLARLGFDTVADHDGGCRGTLDLAGFLVRPSPVTIADAID